jgi:hypothetical protein
MSKTVTIILGATAMEVTPDPTGSNSTELIPMGEIVGVYPVKFNKKPSNADLFYSSISSPASIGDTVTGVTSGATGTIAGFIGTGGFELNDVVGQFEDGEDLTINGSFSKAGTSAGPGTWNGVSGTTSGSGTGATFDVTDATGVYDTVTVVTAGTGYQVGDTITILGTDLGGASPANDLVLTITGDTAVAEGDSQPRSYPGEWIYPYPTITIIEILATGDRKFNIELQDVSNKPTWNQGTLASLNQAIADINAWLP